MGGPPADAEAQGSAWSQVHTAITGAAAVAGLAGYVYLIGGMVTWVRLVAAHLPADPLTAVVDPRVLFAVGFKAVLFVAALFVVVAAVSWLAGSVRWGKRKKAWHAVVKQGTLKAVKLDEAGELPEPAQDDEGEGAVRVVAGFNVIVISVIVGLAVSRIVELLTGRWEIVVGVFALVALTMWVVIAWWGPLGGGKIRHYVFLALFVVVAFFSSAPIGVLVIAGVAIAHLGRVIARLRRPKSTLDLLRSPLPWALLTVYAVAALAYVAQPPVLFTRAVLDTTTGTQTGGYLARNSDGVYLITCQGLADATSRDERTTLIPLATIRSTTLGGAPYRLDSGTHPSLATLLFRALGIGAHPPTWFDVDLRSQRSTCGGLLPQAKVGDVLGAGVLIGPAPPDGQASGGEPPIQKTARSRAQAALAKRFQPTVETTVADRFWPVSVATVLADQGPGGLLHSGLRDTCLVRNGTCQIKRPTLADLTPIGATSDDYLNYPASLANNPSGQFSAFLNGQGVPAPTTRGFLAHPSRVDPWKSAQIYFYDAGVGTYRQLYPGVPPGLRSLQYWFFYPYNYYPTAVGAKLMGTSPIAGDLANADLHEGDWEHVTVLLDPKTMRPRFLYLARHDGEGVALPWNSRLLRFDHGHPIVQAAFGGHPSYPNRCGQYRRAKADNRLSDWVVCGSGRFAFRASTTPLVDLSAVSWGCWPGHFGEATKSELRNGQRSDDDPRNLVAQYYDVAGPRSPLRQTENAKVCARTGP